MRDCIVSFSKWEKLSARRIGNTVWEAETGAVADSAAAASTEEELWSKLFIGIQNAPDFLFMQVGAQKRMTKVSIPGRIMAGNQIKFYLRWITVAADWAPARMVMSAIVTRSGALTA